MSAHPYVLAYITLLSIFPSCINVAVHQQDSHLKLIKVGIPEMQYYHNSILMEIIYLFIYLLTHLFIFFLYLLFFIYVFTNKFT